MMYYYGEPVYQYGGVQDGTGITYDDPTGMTVIPLSEMGRRAERIPVPQTYLARMFPGRSRPGPKDLIDPDWLASLPAFKDAGNGFLAAEIGDCCKLAFRPGVGLIAEIDKRALPPNSVLQSGPPVFEVGDCDKLRSLWLNITGDELPES
jgi:hypothetical protein